MGEIDVADSATLRQHALANSAYFLRQQGPAASLPHCRLTQFPDFHAIGTPLAIIARVHRDLDQFEARTKQFAIDVVWLCARLQDVRGLRQVAWQLSDSAGSVAANHRAMRRARSKREFRAKLQIVNEEIDESVLWLEIAQAVLERWRGKPDAVPSRPPIPQDEFRSALREAGELRSMFAKARRTARNRSRQG
jgi:four helix bundle protein